MKTRGPSVACARKQCNLGNPATRMARVQAPSGIKQKHKRPTHLCDEKYQNTSSPTLALRRGMEKNTHGVCCRGRCSSHPINENYRIGGRKGERPACAIRALRHVHAASVVDVRMCCDLRAASTSQPYRRSILVEYHSIKPWSTASQGSNTRA